MKQLILKYLRNEEGATAIEYGLIVSMIAVASIVGMQLVGNNLNVTFMKIARELDSALRAF